MSVSRAVNIASMGKEKPYSTVGAERVQAKYGISVLLTISVFRRRRYSVFLPKRFTPVFSDTDLNMINGGMIKINLMYHVTSKKTNAYQLCLKEEQE
jgi:hypothetical protein